METNIGALLSPNNDDSEAIREVPVMSGGLKRSMQHHLIEIISFRGGVDETRKTIWAFCGAEGRRMAPLEGGRVVA
jgi:hypothetical protein